MTREELAAASLDTLALLARDSYAAGEELVRRAEAAEELRLTLAAEQGRQEGAPSSGWVYSLMLGCWHKRVSRRSSYGVGRNCDGSAWWSLDAMQPSGNAPTMRAAMKAADEVEAALPTAQES